LYGRRILESDEFRKEAVESWVAGSTYKLTKIGHGEI
jgi:hypothetical protein